MKHIALVKCILLVILTPVWSMSQNLSKDDIDQAVISITSLIEDHYVFENEAMRISEVLTELNRNGDLYNYQDWIDFSEHITGILYKESKDRHLYTRFDPGMVAELIHSSAESQPNSEVISEISPFFVGDDAVNRNFGFREVIILENNIGYIKLSEINLSAKSLPVLFAAMEFVSRTESLIIDLRDNGGGGSDIGAVLESYFLPRNVDLLEFKNRSGDLRLSSTVSWLMGKEYEKPLFIIINEGTASAAEAFAFVMQENNRAVIIGQASAGAAFMSRWFPVNESIYISVSTSAPVSPVTNHTWEKTGVNPDYEIDHNQVQFILDKLLKTKD
jgi:hypothetical protein